MKKALAIAGILALSITPTVSFADHLEPKDSERRPGGNLAHINLCHPNRGIIGGCINLRGFNLSGANLSSADLIGADLRGNNLSGANLSNANLRLAFLAGANLSGANLDGAELDDADLSGADLTGVIATNLIGCPKYLPSGWVCENNSLKQR